MKLIVGLGNPGDKYFNTRHNLGFMVTTALLQKYALDSSTFWENSPKHHAVVQTISIKDRTITLLQPHTFMNNSGQAVSSYARCFNIKPEEILVIYDDVALPLGKIRVRIDGSAGGHNGVQSIIDSLGTDHFLRMRLGIGATDTQMPLENYVLAPFTEAESKIVREMVEKSTKDVELIVENGIEKYLSTYHER